MTSKKSLLNKFILFLFSFLFFAFVNMAYAVPVASISAPEIILTGDTASLSAQNSTGNQLKYRWKLVGKPEGSGSQILNNTQADTSFLVDREGVYLAELRVLEGSTWSTAKYKTISAVASVGEVVLAPEVFEASFLCKISFGLFDCEEVIRDFDIVAPAGNYSLVIENSGIKKAFISLNGVDLTDYYQLSGSDEVVVKKTQLLAHNQLKLRFGHPGSYGEFNSKLKIKIVRNLLPTGQNASPEVSALPIKYFGSLGGKTQLEILDADQTTGHIISVLIPAKSGEVTISPSGLVTYEPDFFYLGDDEVVLLVKDTGFPQKAQAVVIPIQFQNGNEPPLLASTLSPLTNGQTISGKIQVRDTAGQTHLFAIVEAATNGAAIIDSNGNISYTPQDNYIGLDTFTIRVTDSGSPSAYSEIIIPIDVLENHAPIVSSPTLTMEQGMTNTAQFTFSDIDSGQTATISIRTMPANGMATMNSDGTLIYTPDPLFYGQDLVEVSVRDNGHPSQESTMSLLITVLENKPPILTFSPNQLTVSPGFSHRVNFFVNDQNRYQTYTVELADQPAHGTATLESNVLVYTPNSNYAGPDEVVVVVTDNGFPVKKGFATLSITVQENHPPVPVFEGKTITSNKERSFIFYPNDPDAGQQHTFSISAFPENGVLIPSPFWPFVLFYKPNLGFVGNDQFKVVVTDNGVPIMAGEVTVNMTVRANTAPVFSPLRVLKLAQASVKSDSLPASDVDGDKITYKLLTTSTLGTASIFGDYISFSSNKGLSGTEILTIEARDDGEPSLATTAQLQIQVEENHSPAPVDQFLVAGVNQTLQFGIRGLDPDEQQILTFTLLSPPTNGTLVHNGSGYYQYKPNPDFTGVDELTVRVSDNGTPSLFKDTKVTINVEQNFAPQPVANDIIVLEGSFEISRIAINDPNVNQRHAFTVATYPSHGVLRGEGTGAVAYDPNPGYVGQDQFVMTVTDNGIPNLSANVVISVEVERNLPPNPIANNPSVFQGESVQVDVLPNDPNRAVQYFSYEVVTQPSNGYVSANSSRFIYTPAWGFSGQDSFTVKVSDSGNPKLSGFKTVNVQVVKNVDPTVIASDITTFQSTVGSTQVSFTDAEPGQFHTYLIKTNGTHGSAYIDYTGRLTYYPQSGYFGDDVVVVGVKDSANPSGLGTKEVHITVVRNASPVVIANDITTFQSTIATTQVSFTDAEPDQLHTYLIQTNPLHGSASINAQGLLTYTPQSGYSGQDRVIVGVRDNAIPAAVGTKEIIITVVPNALPTVIANDFTTFQSTTATTQVSFTDVEPNQSHAYLIHTSPQHGSANINAQGLLTYYPQYGYSGQDRIIVGVRDNAIPAGVGTKEIIVTIVPNSIPVVVAENITVFQGATSKTQISYTDADLDQTHTYFIQTNPSHGYASINTLGELSYTPSSGYVGSDNIIVGVRDNALPSGEGIKNISITVTPNTAPIIVAENISIFQGSSGTTQLNFTDPDVGQVHQYGIPVQALHGWVIISETGLVTYEATNNCNKIEDTFTIRVSDNIGYSDKEIRVLITPNTAPSISIADLNINQRDTAITQINATDPDVGQVLSYRIHRTAVRGSAVVGVTGQITYQDYNPTTTTSDSFEIIVDDGFGQCSNQASIKTVNVTIAPNHQPVLVGENIVVEQGGIVHSSVTGSDADQFQTLFYYSSTHPTKGLLQVNYITGEYSYTSQSSSGSDLFEITANDNGAPLLSGVKAINVTIVPINFPPVPTANVIALLNGKTANTTISPNDPDVSQVHTYEIISPTQFGWATVSNLGVVSYHAYEGTSGAETIQVKVTDNGAFPRSAIIAVPVEVVKNLAPSPIAQARGVTSGETTQLIIEANDPNQVRFPQTYSYRISNAPQVGTASVDIQGNLTYTAPMSYSGVVTLDIEVSDQGTPSLSSEARITFTIVANQAPVVAAQTLNTAKNVSVQKQIAFTDANSANQTFTYSVVQQGVHGSAAVDLTGQLTYTPDAGYVGADQLIVRVTDSGNPALSGEATYSINVEDSSNTPPTLSSIEAYTQSDGFPKLYEFDLFDLEDSEGYVKEVHIDFGDNTELLVLNEDTPVVAIGEFTLDFFEHFYRQSGTYTVTVTLIDDENAQSQFQTVVQVGNNHPPIARVNFTPNQGSLPLSLVADASASTDSDGTIREYCFRVRKGKVNKFSQCTQGGLQLSYQIAEEGIYQARGCVYDNSGGYNCYTQDIYAGVPVPGAGLFKAFASISASERLGTAPLNNVVLDASQSRGVNGASIVEYQWVIYGRVSNNLGQNFERHLSGVNQTLNLPYAGVYDVNLLVIDENGNEGQAKTEIFVEENAQDSLSIYSLYNGDNNFHFKMNTSGLSFSENKVFWDLGNGDVQQGFEAFGNLESGMVHQIRLEAYDVNGTKHVLTKSIDLTETPTAPVISLQSFPTQVQVNQGFVLNASGSNDPNAPLRFRWWLGDGSPTINGVGLEYSQISHAFSTLGEKTIHLLVSNRQGLSSEMEININVISGQAPTIAATVAPGSGVSPLLVNGQVQGFDPDGTILSYTWNFGAYGRGSRMRVGQNVSNVYYVPKDYYVTVTALDSDGNRVTQFVDTINVVNFNKAPLVASETLSTRKNKILTHDVEFSDEDDESQLHTFSIVSGPTHGVATISSEGRIIYNPSLDYLGSDSLRVRVTDGSTVPAYGEATITIQVTGDENLNPVIAGVDYDYETSSFPRKTFIYFDQLNDPDGEVVKVTWDFGDNTDPLVIESNQLDEYDEVMHQYVQAGTYNVVITAEDNQGGVTTASKEVILTANQMPSAVFSVGTTGTGPYQVTLDATSSVDPDGSIQLYCWNVKSGGIAVYDQCTTSPVQTITTQNGGVATVELYVRDNDHASAFYETNFNIDSPNSFPPYVGFDTAGSRLGSDPFSIQWDSQATIAFQGKTISKKYWVISDTQLTDSFFEGSVANAEYFTPGTHVTRMQAVDSDGKRNSYEQLVYVGQNIPLKADFTVKTEDDLSVSFNAGKWTEGHYSGFFLWDFGDGTHEFDRYTNHTYNRSGKYKVTLTVLDIYGNLDIHEEVILVGGDTPSASPVGDFKMFGNVNSQINFGISGNSSDIVRWNFGDGTFDQGEISEKGNVAHTYTQKGIYRVTTTVTSEESGLSREFDKVISIVGNIPNPQMWIVASQTNGPAPLQVNFVLNHLPHYSPTSYRWLIRNSRGDIIFMGSQSSANFNFTIGGNYTVEVITKDASGNSDYRSYGIFVTDSFNKVKKKTSSMFFMKKRSTRELRHLKKQELLHVRKS